MNVFTIGGEAYYRVSDDLSEAMVSDAAAAVYFENFDTEFSEQLGRGKNPVILGSTTQRENVRMFEQQQIVRFPLGDNLRLELTLKLESITEGNAAEPADFQQFLPHILYNMMFKHI
jgi:hypothetical protein